MWGSISYTLKKQFFGGGSMSVSFIVDESVKLPVIKHGSKVQILVGRGLPMNSRPDARVAANWDSALGGVAKLKKGISPQMSMAPPPQMPVALPQVPAAPPMPLAPSIQTTNPSRENSPNPLGKKPPPPPPKKKKQPAFRALYAYTAQEADELTFNEGDVLYLIRNEQDGWMFGTKSGSVKQGLFPANYVEPM
jgi:hypothetical protein